MKKVLLFMIRPIRSLEIQQRKNALPYKGSAQLFVQLEWKITLFVLSRKSESP